VDFRYFDRGSAELCSFARNCPWRCAAKQRHRQSGRDVKVTDFGVAEALTASRKGATANREKSIHYDAPEIVSGGHYTPASDIYSLGVSLFEMLTGALPYPGETIGVVAERHRSDPIPSPRSLNPGVPKSLEGIVMKAMQKNASDRYASAGRDAGDLRTVRECPQVR